MLGRDYKKAAPRNARGKNISYTTNLASSGEIRSCPCAFAIVVFPGFATAKDGPLVIYSVGIASANQALPRHLNEDLENSACYDTTPRDRAITQLSKQFTPTQGFEGCPRESQSMPSEFHDW